MTVSILIITKDNKMKKILSAVAVSAILSTGAMAEEMYGSIGLAMTTLSHWDSGVSLVARGGMKLDKVLPNFAVELEVSQTVVDPSLDGFYSSDWDLSILGVGAYAVYNFNIPDTSVNIKPRLGLNYQSWSIDGSGVWGGADADDTSLSFGVGATYPLSPTLEGYVDYTDKGDSNNLGAGVQMRF